MKLGRVRRDYFQQKFGVDIEQRFAEPMSKLSHDGFLTHDKEGLRLNREGLLQVDKLLHDFFLPEHRNAGYA
jgi:oxygen-independent coproporphyrinogen-3 oxidase